jgi:hypothetical protein
MVPASYDAQFYFSQNQPASPDGAYNRTTHAWDIAPSANYSSSERFALVEFPYPSDNPQPGSAFLFFPVLSGYWKSDEYLSGDDNNALIVFEWYCTNETTYNNTRNQLFQYLSQNGNVTVTTIDLHEQLLRSKNPYLMALNESVIPVWQYEGNMTAGYFVFRSPAFSGDLYRISYYGTTGLVLEGSEFSSGYGQPGTASLETADAGIRSLMVRKIFNLVSDDSHTNGILSSKASLPDASPFFPALSPYHAGSEEVYLPTGDRYLSEAWYFTSSDALETAQSVLLRNLTGTGTVSPVTLDFSRELEEPGSGNATLYIGPETSGYFVTGPYTICYDGIVGSFDVKNDSHPLKLLILNVLSPENGIGSLTDKPAEYTLQQYMDNSGMSVVLFWGAISLVLVIIMSAALILIRSRRHA